MRRPVVEVLMSTYNGERYLRQQIDSILRQEDVDVRLVVRDDGSTDATLQILAAYDEDPRVVVRSGQNLGLPEAFFRLIQESGSDADFWALADQDDIWRPEKLAHAIECLRQISGPAMYCGRVLVVDEALEPVGPHTLAKKGPSFGNALVQNIATGCTIVFNAPARGVLRGRWPTYSVMHDAWLYLVLTGTGTVVYDPEMYVLYRQHARNAVGIGKGRLSRLRGRVRRQLSRDGAGAHSRQNGELLQTHGDVLLPSARRQLQDFLDSRGKLTRRAVYAVKGAAHRQTVGSDLVLKVLYVWRRA